MKLNYCAEIILHENPHEHPKATSSNISNLDNEVHRLALDPLIFLSGLLLAGLLALDVSGIAEQQVLCSKR